MLGILSYIYGPLVYPSHSENILVFPFKVRKTHTRRISDVFYEEPNEKRGMCQQR